ncbi:transcriptional regulator [Amycolatopsis regifaucium]|uniref:Transcriptional regulator n=2 Tax=Amycolatopsis regifaucium TaxID=546365 RepID=A0A154MEW6_9PSEU|nr:transcriptional regulator [Amycolatopsis regifaucium]OKA11338.1 transcriptional regulator [Amycolatopsis regifaucium]
MRTAAIARRAGYSVQQVRNLERDGVLPPAARTPSGYRSYGEIHVRSALAYRALAAGVGPVEAKKIVRAAHREPVGRVLALLDAAHAALDTERAELREAREAVRVISGEPIGDVRGTDAMSVSELATALGLRPSTLRHWDTERLVVPSRDRRGTRRYTPAQVRDARIVHQLRLAGYRVEPLRALMPELRRSRRLEDVTAALAARDDAITVRSRALFDGTAALSAVLSPDSAAVSECSARTPSPHTAR